MLEVDFEVGESHGVEEELDLVEMKQRSLWLTYGPEKGSTQIWPGSSEPAWLRLEATQSWLGLGSSRLELRSTWAQVGLKPA